MVYTQHTKNKRYVLIRKGGKSDTSDTFSIDSNSCVHDELTISEQNEEAQAMSHPPEVINEPLARRNSLLSNESLSDDSFDEKYVQGRSSLNHSATQHFMLPTQSSSRRESILQEEKQRRSILVQRRPTIHSDRNTSKQTQSSSKSEVKQPCTDKEAQQYSHLPRFMQPTKAYLQSLKPDARIAPRKSIPSMFIRTVNTEQLPRYMKQTKASINHYNEEQKKRFIKDTRSEFSKPRDFQEPAYRSQPMSSHDAVAIGELRRELEKVLQELNKGRRVSVGKVKCTAIKKREGNVANEEEVNERVRQEIEKMYPRYMKSNDTCNQFL